MSIFNSSTYAKSFKTKIFKKFFWWHSVAFIDYYTHLYEVVRPQLRYMQLYNTQHAYNFLQNIRCNMRARTIIILRKKEDIYCSMQDIGKTPWVDSLGFEPWTFHSWTLPTEVQIGLIRVKICQNKLKIFSRSINLLSMDTTGCMYRNMTMQLKKKNYFPPCFN